MPGGIALCGICLDCCGCVSRPPQDGHHEHHGRLDDGPAPGRHVPVPVGDEGCPDDRCRRVPEDSPTLGLDRDEAVAILGAAEAASAGDHALICLLLLNGFRIAEACGIDLSDLSIERGHRVVVITRKAGRRERHSLCARTAHAIDALAAELRNDSAPSNSVGAPLLLGRTRGGTPRRLNGDDATRDRPPVGAPPTHPVAELMPMLRDSEL